MITNLDPTTWLREQIAMESEGEITPAQPNIEIRPDFPGKSFGLYSNGELLGKSSQHKALSIARRFLLGEQA